MQPSIASSLSRVKLKTHLACNHVKDRSFGVWGCESPDLSVWITADIRGLTSPLAGRADGSSPIKTTP